MPTPLPPLRLADINVESYIYFGAGAAVAWQLAYPGVGRGVARHSQTLQRPVSRLRATMRYIYAISLGSDEDRAAIARHVNRAHVPVRGEGYSAFDPELQLWVAATLYRGGVEMYELFRGPVPVERRESLYREAWAFGRTLQVDDAQWPPTADAFDAWWESRQAMLKVDDEVREYLHLVLRRGAPWYLRLGLPLQAFVTQALLPPHIRALFALTWTQADERRWQMFRKWAPRLYWSQPRWLRHLPAQWALRRMRAER